MACTMMKFRRLIWKLLHVKNIKFPLEAEKSLKMLRIETVTACKPSLLLTLLILQPWVHFWQYQPGLRFAEIWMVTFSVMLMEMSNLVRESGMQTSGQWRSLKFLSLQADCAWNVSCGS